MTEEQSNQGPLVGDLTGAGKLADSKLVNKVYDDALSPLMTQLGELGEDVLKTGRLLLFPLQVLAAQHDRFAKWVKRLAEAVPEERRQDAPPSVAGPILRQLTFRAEEDPVADLYLNLLARAMDKERSDEAHPAFINIIGQLSPDEALVLLVLRDDSVVIETEWKIDTETGRVYDPVTTKNTFPVERVTQPERLIMYYRHLDSLGLVRYAEGMKNISRRTGRDNSVTCSMRNPVRTNIAITDFGRLFIGACVSDDFVPLTQANPTSGD